MINLHFYHWRITSFIIIIILILSSCTQQDGYTLNGLVEGFDDSTMLFLRDSDIDKVIDSSYVIDGKFTFSGKVDDPKNVSLRTKFEKGISPVYTYFWLENSEIIIKGERDDFKYVEITGSKLQAEADILKTRLKSNRKNRTDLIKKLRKTDRSDKTTFDKLLFLQDSLRKDEDKITLNYIRNYPNHLNSAFYLSFRMYNKEKQELLELFHKFSEANKNSKYGKVIKSYLELCKDFEVGDTVENFTINDTNGQPVSLSDYRGQYMLLEFWSSGCGGCYYENKILVNSYKKYHHNGFEILGVSLDKNRNKWIQKITSDSLIWTNVCDFKGYSGKVALTYKVNYVPKSFLIDPEGKIIAKDLRKNALGDKLEEIFKN